MKGEYKTKPRNAIIEYLKENADTRFTARDILNAIKEQTPYNKTEYMGGNVYVLKK